MIKHYFEILENGQIWPRAQQSFHFFNHRELKKIIFWVGNLQIPSFTAKNNHQKDKNKLKIVIHFVGPKMGKWLKETYKFFELLFISRFKKN